MNKRIRELANQARSYADSYELPDPNIQGNGWVALFEQKFAELVVRECARIANEKEENFPQYDPDTSVHWYILKHFELK